MAGPVIRQLLIRAGADFSSMRRELNNAQNDLEKFRIGIRSTMLGIGAALATLGAGIGLNAAVNDAIKFEALMGTLSRTLGRSMGDFKKWQQTVGDVMGFSKLQTAEMANDFSIRLKSIAKDEKDLLQKTTNLIRAAAVIRSNNGMEMTEISERMRSAMNQEQDGAAELGIDVRVAALQQSKAYKELANNAPWAELGMGMQKTILYHHILEQTTKNFGTEIAQNTALLKGGFIAALSDTRMALGQAFLPILNIALPLLTRLARAVEVVFLHIAGIMRALFPKANIKASNGQTAAIDAQSGAVDGLGDSFKKAGKEAAKASRQVMGFDEVNQLQEPDKGGAGEEDELPVADIQGGLGLNDLGANDGGIFEISDKAKKAAEDFKKAIKEILGVGNIKKFAEEWDDLADSFGKFTQAVSDLANNPVIEKISGWLAKNWGHQFMKARISDVQLLSGTFEGWAGVMQMFDGVLALDFDKFFTGFENWVAGIGESTEGFIRIFNGDWADKFGEFREKFGEAWKGMREDIKAYGDPTKIEAMDFVNYIKDKVSGKWKEIKEDAGIYWKAANVVVTQTWEDLKKDVSPYYDLIKTAIGMKWGEIKEDAGEKWEKIKTAVSEKWDSFQTFVNWDNIKTWVSNRWDSIKTTAGTSWEDIKKTVSDKWDTLKDFVKWDNVKTWVSDRWTAIDTAAGTAWDTIKQTVSDKWDEFKDFIKWDNLKTSVATVWTNIKDGVGVPWENIKKAVSEQWDKIVNLDFNGVKTSISTVWKAIKKETEEIFEDIVGVVKAKVNSVIRSVNGFIDKVNSFSINIPALKVGDKELTPAFSFSMPKMPRIPELARGGVVDGKTNMGNYIAGEAGAEMIVPLENTSFTDKIASALGTAVMTAMQMQQGGKGDTIIQISGVEIARAIQPYTTGESNRLGSSMLRTT
ncbi:hypothetical protein KP806_07560 [Paenibacillus sp. N4]|uniref:phage tail protein n=1 Tax=Paenibacillus vietnamensis TaxID=2590547 RepID=UPI001CD095CB|nr:hypothetical protein [Paenibacillus vietnamensis]MCA0754903.1 hypothetical protein [Paenibacillus vietnamensis]